jgi:hypothetical protein
MAANPSIQLGTDGNWAIKEDNLLAYKKDGTRFFNKEFDFTRGSLATFVDKDGLIKVSGVTDTELIVNGDFATDSDWSKAGSVEILNGLASFTITSGSFAKISQNISLTNNKTYKLTLQVLGDNSGSNIYVRDTATGDNGGLQKTIILVEGTTDYTFYFTANANSNAIYIKRNTSSGNYQFSIDNVSVKEIQTDVPRIDFTDDATGHLLLEPQSTNLIPYSEDFAEWQLVNISTELSNTLSPDGLSFMTKATFSSQGTNSYVRQNRNMNSGSITVSVFVKKGLIDSFTSLRIASVDNPVFVWFNLDNGTIASETGSPTNKSIVDYGNGIYRISVTTTSTSDLSFSTMIQSASSDGGVPTENATQFYWGGMAENQSYPTSYIPTFGSTATRNADRFGQIDFVDEIKNATNFTFFYESAIVEQPSNDNDCFRVDGDLGSQTIGEYQQTNNRVYYADTQNNTRIISFALPYTPNVPHKVVWQVDNSNLTIKLFINGLLRRTGTLLEAFVLDDYRLGSTETTVKYNSLAMFPTALTDGEMYLLTTTQYQSYQEMATALNYTL